MECQLSEGRIYNGNNSIGSDGVSKLATKNATKGTAHKKGMIHSIPKFSQVLPNQQLAEAQRVLQEILLKKKLGAMAKVNDSLKRASMTRVNSHNDVDLRASTILQ